MRNVFGGFLGPAFQPRIDRKRHLRHFVNGGRNRGGLAEAVSGSEGLQLVGVHRVHHAVK